MFQMSGNSCTSPVGQSHNGPIKRRTIRIPNQQSFVRLFLKPILNIALILREYVEQNAIISEREPHSIEPLDFERAGNRREQVSRQIGSWLKAVLRRFPWWSEGHLRLGQIALLQNELSLAYASAQAVLQLSSGKNQRKLAGLLLSRALLKTGSVTEAKEILESLDTTGSEGSAIKEELAACYLSLENFELAAHVLASIPTTEISPAAKSALLYANYKLSKGSSESPS